ncbi:serine hydrolase [Candidatus Dojkabacteria bacterium]|uniref:Serine hydrolase n=1 Tax=Candidatus Dojkabacteria bacterium TaxID=2099670 RepID=A0A5C7JA10_9BACT|nr:MAG: serine hydrolase [Candidatus Dojkabacteria bacterium]
MNAKIFSAIIGLVGIGFVGGYAVRDMWPGPDAVSDRGSEEETSKQIRQMGAYRYINPLLECDIAGGTIDARKENFSSELSAFTEQVKRERGLTEAAIYFRDLNNGPTFGVDVDGEFFPASLLKVPVMMAYYRWPESVPGLLGTQIDYEERTDFGMVQYIKSRIELEPGQSYSIDQLIERMIKYSDNQATYLLIKYLPQEKMIDLFRMVGVGEDVIMDGQAKLTVKEYASFFRILFNSSYLSADNSERALDLLAHTEYHDALPGRLPQGVVVAHKFGEAGTENIERQLHDCGIVYLPDHPYLACIMTRGRDAEKLKLGIQDISRFIYDRVDEQY